MSKNDHILMGSKKVIALVIMAGFLTLVGCPPKFKYHPLDPANPNYISPTPTSTPLTFSVSPLGYFPAGAPTNLVGPPAMVYDASSMVVLNNRNKILITEPSPRGGHVADALGPEATIEDVVDVLEMSYSNISEIVWDGYRTVFSVTGISLANVEFLDMWVKGDGNTVRMTVEIGNFSEDSNGNGILDDEDTNGDGAVPPIEDIGIPIYYIGANIPWNRVNRRDLEDMNLDGYLDTTESFYSYSFEVNWAGWKFIRISAGPAEWSSGFSSKTYDSAGVSVDYFRIGSPDFTSIRQGRIWVTGIDATLQNGILQIESIRLN